MTRITKFAALAFLVNSYPALRRGRQQHGSRSAECASPGDAASRHQTEANPITPAAGRWARARMRRNRSREPTSLLSRREAATKRRHATSSPARRVSAISRRIEIAGGALALPKVAYYGVPVILDVPGLGFVDVPEDEYARLYEKLSSSDSGRSKTQCLRSKFKEAEEAEVEALQHAREWNLTTYRIRASRFFSTRRRACNRDKRDSIELE